MEQLQVLETGRRLAHVCTMMHLPEVWGNLTFDGEGTCSASIQRLVPSVAMDSGTGQVELNVLRLPLPDPTMTITHAGQS